MVQKRTTQPCCRILLRVALALQKPSFLLTMFTKSIQVVCLSIFNLATVCGRLMDQPGCPPAPGTIVTETRPCTRLHPVGLKHQAR
ncbi:uncharacterized protein BKA78DRAFT_318178 [Phyllosticta capitalensis]|uniref:uncharacterized protein n=1 Tax=Phyllosticta capitalensis TaxID=121624 RepID=UPI003131EC5F